ncbi:MAG: hypothetical protein RL385_2028 [Pseudomonadota bacterium]|jgi:hypothetical protein
MRTWISLCFSLALGAVACTGDTGNTADTEPVLTSATGRTAADAGEAGPTSAAVASAEAGSPAEAASPMQAESRPDAGSMAAPPPSANVVKRANTYFFGHSLVGWDMPNMLVSFASARQQSFSFHGQIGYGTSLKMHVDWDGAESDAPFGFANDSYGHAGFVGEGKAELDTGKYDVVVMTESNGHTATDGSETAAAALALAKRARSKNPSARLFLYANWLSRNEFADLSAWQKRTLADLPFWERVADRVNAQLDGEDLHVLPVGQILAKITADLAAGKLSGVSVDDLFRDDVHVNDLGFYIVAAAHYAAIFQASPQGLPVQVNGEHGPAKSLPSGVASAVQTRVWEELSAYPRSGVKP